MTTGSARTHNQSQRLSPAQREKLEPIPLTNVAWQHAQVRAEIDAAIDELLTDPTCDDGRFTRALEADFRTFFGNGYHAIGVQSGSSAQFLILKALGIGPGDEVITVPNSDMATTAAISRTGATFRLVDVDWDHNMDPTRIEAAITKRTRAIVPVHMYGNPARIDAIADVAQRYGLPLIEDATLALGAASRGHLIGTLGRAAFFSFAPRKVLGGTGNGGLVVTADTELADRIQTIKAYGLDPAIGERPIGERHQVAAHLHVAEGFNLKMDGIQAAVVRAKCSRLQEWGALRQEVADAYRSGFTDAADVICPSYEDDVQPAWRNYVVRLPEQKRDRVRAAMKASAITTSVLYAPPVHLQPVYQSLGWKAGAFPVAEALGRQLLCLPIYPGMTPAEVDRVITELRAAL